MSLAGHHSVRTDLTSKRANRFTAADWDDPHWHRYARCSDVHCSHFFPVGKTGEAITKIDDAKRFCGPCPVQEVCLEYALQTNQSSGIWGGRSEDERRAIKRKRAAS